MAKQVENNSDSLAGKLGRLFLSPIPIEDLRELIREVFREMLPAIKSNAKWEDEKVMDNHELSREFHISIPTIWKYRREGVIPYFRVGNRIRFRRTEVHKALETLKWKKKQ